MGAVGLSSTEGWWLLLLTALVQSRLPPFSCPLLQV